MYYECKCTFEMINKNNLQKKTSGQSYKQFTLINYDCKVVMTSKLLML